MLFRFIVCWVSLSVFSGCLWAQQNPATEGTPEKGWEIGFGAEGLAFYGCHEEGLSLSKNPFNEGRATMGMALSVGKWVAPQWLLRTKVSGYWGRAIVSDYTQTNSSRFFSIQEQVLFDLLAAVKGKNYRQRYQLLPLAGMGFSRNCSYNHNAFSVSAGVKQAWRLNELFALHTELGWTYAGHGTERTPGYHLLSAEVGLTFSLGKVKKRAVNPNYIYKDYGTTRYKGFAKRVEPTDTLSKIVLHKHTTQGMVLVNRGAFTMGPEERDSVLFISHPSRRVSLDEFWMDATEVTNRMYREFVQDVVRETVNRICGNSKNKAERKKAYESLLVVDPVTGNRSFDGNRLYYRYSYYDERAAILMEGVSEREKMMIKKDTAWVDDDGNIIRKQVVKPWQGRRDFMHTYIVPVLPDTTVWLKDFPEADMGLYTKYYFSHKDYEDYPVVGVSWEQAQAFCAWRTEKRKIALGGSLGMEQPFRLPTEAEWEFAARIVSSRIFPWSKEVTMNKQEILYANYQPAEGDYTLDGNLITSKVGSYPCNENGLFDMAGNVAEWTATAYTDEGVEEMNCINPLLVKKDTPACVKGGSWKDPLRFIQATERKGYQRNAQHAFIGFRCVRSVATKPTQKTIRIK